MMGDRVAAILVAMLIVVTSLQSDLGLGKLSCAAYHPTRLPLTLTTPPPPLTPHTFDLARYLIWVDTFNLTSLVMLSIALVESILVHLLCRRNYMVTACTPMTSGRLEPTSTQTPREHLRTPTP